MDINRTEINGTAKKARAEDSVEDHWLVRHLQDEFSNKSSAVSGNSTLWFVCDSAFGLPHWKTIGVKVNGKYVRNVSFAPACDDFLPREIPEQVKVLKDIIKQYCNGV